MKPSDPTDPRPARAEVFPRRLRITARRDFTATYDAGRRHGGRLVVVFARPRDGEGRLGVTATRKVGNAVVRNRARRRVREIYRRWHARAPLSAALEVVVNVTARSAGAPFAALEAELSGLLDRAAASAWPERA
ncbi:MAG TPA: ribonuclease P protein component [Thermoanaerobaculia bacterium]|nr:ribonuclease P protein component [Thermoanaerobaculia bacterium]